jgi:hypothetical protein
VPGRATMEASDDQKLNGDGALAGPRPAEAGLSTETMDLEVEKGKGNDNKNGGLTQDIGGGDVGQDRSTTEVGESWNRYDCNPAVSMAISTSDNDVGVSATNELATEQSTEVNAKDQITEELLPDSSNVAAAGTNAEVAANNSMEESYEHKPSEYELQRMERIKRNREYLASLGLDKLDKKKTATSSCHKARNSKRRKSDNYEDLAKREKSSRLKGKDFIFNEGDLLRKAAGIIPSAVKEKQRNTKNTPGKASSNKEATPLSASKSSKGGYNDPTADPNVGKENGQQKLRYRDFVYKELKRQVKLRRDNIKISERFVRRAENEVRMAQRDHKMLLRKQERQRDWNRRRTHQDILRRAVNNPDIVERLRTEERVVKAQADAAERDANIGLLSTLAGVKYEWPQAVKRVEAELDGFVLGTLEDDTNDSSFSLVQPLLAQHGTAKYSKEENSTSSRNKQHKNNKASPTPLKKRFPLVGLPRYVQGPVSSSFSTSLDTAWLESYQNVEPSAFATFVPQVGDNLL